MTFPQLTSNFNFVLCENEIFPQIFNQFGSLIAHLTGLSWVRTPALAKFCTFALLPQACRGDRYSKATLLEWLFDIECWLIETLNLLTDCGWRTCEVFHEHSFGVSLYFILYIGLVLVRAKHIDSEELHQGVTLYVSRKIRRVIGKRIEVNLMRSVPNDMTDALNHCVLSAFTILDLALLFLLFLSNHTIFNFSKSLFFDTSILVPFVTLDQGLNPWRWKQILFMVPTDIAAFRNISHCNN